MTDKGKFFGTAKWIVFGHKLKFEQMPICIYGCIYPIYPNEPEKIKSDIYGKKGQFGMKPQLIFTKFTLGKS